MKPLDNFKITDFSDGVNVDSKTKERFVNDIVSKLQNGDPYHYWRTGNFLAIGVNIEGYLEVFITENYQILHPKSL